MGKVFATKTTWWLIAPLSVFLLLAWAYLPESIDDAYITLRYAKNLMRGFGPVFNAGERVEGYSNPAWMFLLAAVGWFGLSMPLAMKVLGIASGAGTVLITKKIADKWFESPLIGFGAALLISASPFMALWAADGLETAFYCFFVTLLLWLGSSDEEKGWLSGLVAAVVVLTRPEGIMFAALIVIYQLVGKRYNVALRCLFLWLVAFMSYEAFRVSYFGQWVPNTAFVKVHAGWEYVGAAVHYIKAFNRDSGFFLIPLVVCGAILHFRKKYALLAVSFIFAQMFFLALCGGDFMFGYRFLLPIFPICIIFVCGAIKQITKQQAVQLIILVGVAIWLGVSQLYSRPPLHFSTDNMTYRASEHFAVASYLRNNTRDTDTVLLSEAGIIPYGIEAKVIDYLGLVSPYWTVFSHDRKINVDGLLNKNPKYVVLSFVEDINGVVRPRIAEDVAIASNPEFERSYFPIRRFELDRSASLLNYIYYFYSPDANRIYFEVFLKRKQ